jgi:Zn-dependent membrane protease YugP
MAVFGIIAFALLLAVVYAPQYWVQYTMKRHGEPRPDFPGTGGELAEHLVEQFKLDGVKVEATDGGDHYDPGTRTVRLSNDNFNSPSLTGVAVAAHEVGHALQHAYGDGGLALRQRLVRVAAVTDRIASIFFVAAPVLFVIVRSPGAIFGMVALGISLLAIRVIVHLVTLPVEYDASFKKALPILEEGGYLQPDDVKGARSVLKAAALTYVAGALMSLLNLARWIRILR